MMMMMTTIWGRGWGWGWWYEIDFVCTSWFDASRIFGGIRYTYIKYHQIVSHLLSYTIVPVQTKQTMCIFTGFELWFFHRKTHPAITQQPLGDWINLGHLLKHRKWPSPPIRSIWSIDLHRRDPSGPTGRADPGVKLPKFRRWFLTPNPTSSQFFHGRFTHEIQPPSQVNLIPTLGLVVPRNGIIVLCHAAEMPNGAQQLCLLRVPMNATGIEDTFCLLVKLDTPQQKQTSREGMLSDGGIPASFKKFHCCQLKKR